MMRHALVALAASILAVRAASPVVRLDNGTFTGVTDFLTDSWMGIPYGQPPTGPLRFRQPVAVGPYSGQQQATAFGPGCPQQKLTLPILSGLVQEAADYILNSAYGVVFPGAEDCLTLNVVAPHGTKPGANLPVAFWIFGGGFELGDPSLYDGSIIVNRAIELDEPIIYVSLNYRLSAFGFLASKEVTEAGVGNLGLQDQRLALRWVQNYISNFGGDPTKVTIWGESAGAISVALHMVTNGGNNEGLFRGAFMQSGSPIPVGPGTNGQVYYDALVEATGCSGASDTLDCLRGVPYQALLDAVNLSPGLFSFQSLTLAWLPRVDGTFLTEDPQLLVSSGSVSPIPFVSGDCDDEGTLFSLSTLNLTTSDHVTDYMQSVWLPHAAPSDIAQLLDLYPEDITQGSPFDTGILNAISPQFKRLAALQGDVVFQGPRRVFMQTQSPKVNVWGFISKRNKALPVLGSVHISDLLNIYGNGEMTDYLINFVNTLNPNGWSQPNWPKYTTSSPNMMTFTDNIFSPTEITQDNFREDAINFASKVMLSNPLR